MTYDWQIKTGDRVHVYYDGNGTPAIYGTVRHYPQATGECWIIETDFAIHYVQTFAQIMREK